MLNLSFLTFIFTLCLVSTLVGQADSKETAKSKTTGVVDAGSVKMKEVDLGFIKLSIPASLERKEMKCIEGGCWEFSDSENVLTIDWNVDCGRPTFERWFASYAEEVLLVDDVRTWLWSFLDDREFKFLSGANYATEKQNRIGLGIYFSSKTTDSRPLAKNIFKSVKFQKKELVKPN